MEFFVYCRDAPGSGPLRERHLEAHWSFMDGYAAGMVARGPTLADDGATPTGSMHIVDLADAEAARRFAYEEPNYAAGVYREVMIRRWQNALVRTMWEFEGGPEGGSRYLVVGHGRPGTNRPHEELREAHGRFVDEQDRARRLIVCGPLLSDDGTEWAGSVLAVELPSRAAVEAMLADEPYARAGLYERVEIHRWEFGGRR